MGLSKAQIKRIDGFLDRLGCEYIDIRFEMVDHIATDIENNVTDTNVFFEKDGFNTPFLKYMLSKKAYLEDNYEKQVRKRFWSDLEFVFKSIAKELVNIKLIFIIIGSFILLQFAMNYSVKYTVIFTTWLLTVGYIVLGSYFYYRTKKVGKIKIIQSFIGMGMFPMMILVQNPNIFTIYKTIYHQNIVAYIHFGGIIFCVLLFLSFIRNNKNFKKKYNYLILK